MSPQSGSPVPWYQTVMRNVLLGALAAESSGACDCDTLSAAS